MLDELTGLWSASGVFKTYFLLPLILPLAWLCPGFGKTLFRPLERWVDRIALKPWRAIVVVGAVSLLLSVGLGVSTRIAAPNTHDEFGYLLIADTLAHGRVANPPHPYWKHFESVHIMQQPTYASKYPPAQGLALMFGEMLGNLPILGVWVTTALASATITWMLMAWTHPRVALAGGLLTAFHPQIVAWSQNYWGGAVALGGGAIVLGAFRRILREPRVRDALWLGVGMAILANSRPYEGFVFAFLICATLAIWMVSKAGPSLAVSIRRILLPLSAVLVLLAAQIGYYNYRITGSPVRMPYVVCEETYGIAPLFIFHEPKKQPEYRHREIQFLQLQYLHYYQSQTKSLGTLAAATAQKVFTVLQAALWSLLLIVPLLALPWAMRGDRWMRLIIPAGGIFFVAMLLGTWVSPHYAAPAGGLFVILVIASWRQLRVWKVNGRTVGLACSRLIVVLATASTLLTFTRLAQAEHRAWGWERQSLLNQLEATPGKHLAFVHYGPSHNPHREWVYNSADIDGAKVALARILSPGENAELCRYFADRSVWVIEADATPPTLRKVANAAEIPERIPPRPPAN